MGIQNADDALRIVTRALDDIPENANVNEFLRRQQRQSADEAFFNSYLEKYPQFRVEVPKPSINNSDVYAAAKEKERQVKERILKGARKKAIDDAAAAAEKRFYELGYTDDLPNAQELIDGLHHEEILNTPFPYFSDKWQPTIPQSTSQEVPRTVASASSTNTIQQVPSAPISDLPIITHSPRELAEQKWALLGQFQYKPVLIDGKTRGIAWDKEEWIQDYLSKTPQSKPQESLATVDSTPQEISNPKSIVDNEVISSQPGMTTPEPVAPVQQTLFPPKPIPEGTPESGINYSVDGKRVFSSAGIPVGDGGDSSNYDFDDRKFSAPEDTSRYANVRVPQGETPGQPRIPGLLEQVYDTGNKWKNAAQGIWSGFVNNIEGGRTGRAQSAIPRVAQVVNDQDFQARTPEGKVGQVVGEGTADWMGSGTRQNLWNAFPPDFVATHGVKFLGEDASRVAQVVVPFAAVTGLELGSQTYNPFNLAEGGRVAGYQAINPDDEDPRISTTPVSELIIDRGFFGKRGRLLPWEQFRQERTDIPYEQYEKYQNYLKNKDDNLLRQMTGGLVKGTMDGINGPELSVMGYSVTPTGALAAGAALLAGRELVKSGRIAAFRKQ